MHLTSHAYVLGHVQGVTTWRRCGVGSHGLSGPASLPSREEVALSFVRFRRPRLRLAAGLTEDVLSETGLVLVLDGVNDLDLRSRRVSGNISTTWLNTFISVEYTEVHFYFDQTYSTKSLETLYFCLQHKAR